MPLTHPPTLPHAWVGGGGCTHSYVFFAYNLPLPHIAAGEDFLSLSFVSQLLRESGALFMRRKALATDPL